MDIPPNLRADPEIRRQYRQDPVYQGAPDFVFAGQDVKTTAEILAWANAQKIPVTFCASQTAMTGSGVADSGIALTLNPMNRVLDIEQDRLTGEAFAVCEPGIVLDDLKKTVWNAGYYYPPDPTSFREARLGGTIATNATGSDSFKYGPTRQYVQELEILTASGERKTLKRRKPLVLEHPKNKAGYFLGGEPIDEIIGSEGTLALITKIKVRLLSNAGRSVFYLVLPFSSFASSLRAVVEILKLPDQPRALEWIGPEAAGYFQACAVCPQELKRESCFLYLKEDYFDDGDLQKKIETWFAHLKKIYATVNEKPAFERIFAATTTQQQNDLHACRHHIPLKVNEEFFPYTKTGGGKIGTDWWVPTAHLLTMMLSVYEDSQKLGIPFLAFGHIGNGHPHWDYLCKTAEEYQKANAMVLEHCRKAAFYGGGVAGEHGIGKLKRDLLNIQHSPEIIEEMRRLKQKWDPDWILGRGNLFKKM